MIPQVEWTRKDHEVPVGEGEELWHWAGSCERWSPVETNGQNTKKLQEMVFYNQARLISVKNRVKVSTFHHPRFVCVYLPSSLLWQKCLTGTASSAVIDIHFVSFLK